MIDYSVIKPASQQSLIQFEEENALRVWYSYLPPKPLTLRDKQSPSILSKKSRHFLKVSHTQHNAINSKGTIVYDIDRDTNPIELFNDLHLPIPNLWVSNRDNGKGHAMYLLEAPVHLNTDSSNAPIKWASAIEQSYTKRLQADLSYSGYMCKNALNEGVYKTSILNNNTYDLAELWKFVCDEKFDARAKTEATGFGRNCTLFDSVRFWAYRQMRRYLEGNNKPLESYWHELVLQAAVEQNAFNLPLYDKEVRQIAKSISKWVYHKYNPMGLSAEEFSTRQSKRARQGILLADGSKAPTMADRGRISKRSSNPLSVRSQKPWKELGISRKTYYKRKAKGVTK